MELVKPSLTYKTSFQFALREYLEVDGTTSEGDPMDIEGYLRKAQLFERGIDIPVGKVPASTFWLIDKGEFIGRVGIRRKLNNSLRAEGGNIGYSIRPSKRNLGYGYKILELALIEAQKLRLKKVLLTCDRDNLASQKIIEKNGGKAQISGAYQKSENRYYWIHL